MAESEAVERNAAIHALALARARMRNGYPEPAPATTTPPSPTQEAVGDATLSWASGDIREVQGHGEEPLPSELQRVAGVSGTVLKATEQKELTVGTPVPMMRDYPSGVDEIVNWKPRGK
jgi:hypothetical protein